MRIFPLSESAITIEFGSEISPELNDRAIALAAHFNQNPFPGVIEAAPAYASVTLFYDIVETRRAFPGEASVFSVISDLVRSAAETISESPSIEPRLVEIPMIISKHDSPDLESISDRTGLSPDEVIGMFTSRTYRVYMLGFLPGFAYMGEVDERIATPRLPSPCTKVPQGSIGIAGKQTGIYPLVSPGGWNLIGRTDIRLFDPKAAEPTLLKPGDEVRFVRK